MILPIAMNTQRGRVGWRMESFSDQITEGLEGRHRCCGELARSDGFDLPAGNRTFNGLPYGADVRSEFYFTDRMAWSRAGLP